MQTVDNECKVDGNFLTLIKTEFATANAIYSNMVNFFNRHSVPYKNKLIDFANDGKTSMMGSKNTLKMLNSSIFQIRSYLCENFVAGNSHLNNL